MSEQRSSSRTRMTRKYSSWVTMMVLAISCLAAFTTVNAYAAGSGGNNGTLKIHEQGTPVGTENNDPKVCSFNVEGFNFDEGQTGYVTFDVQGGDGPTGSPAGPYDFGPTDADGYYATQYFQLAAGHYKATLYGKDGNGDANYDDVKAKSKVFKVTCQATTPAPPCNKCPVPDTRDHSKGNARCSGTIRGGVYDTIRVKKGSSCTLIHVYVNKSVIANGAKNVRVLDSTVVHSVRLRHVTRDIKIGNKVGCKFDPQVGHSIFIQDSHNVLICQMTVCGTIALRGNDGQVTVRDSSARRISVTRTHRLVRPYATGHRHPEYIRVLDSRAKHFVARHNHPSRRVVTRGSIFGSAA